MKISSAITFSLLLIIAPLTSSWRIRLYRNTGYQVLILDKSDLYSTTCQNIPTDLNDQVSSLHWESEGVFGKCTIMLYQNANCAINIGRSTTDWDNPRFSDEHDNEVSSWRVDCPDP